MSTKNIVRAWKDAGFRASLSDAERAQLPENPAGSIEMTDSELDAVVGGEKPWTYSRTWCGSCKWFTIDCCGGPTATC